MNWIKFDSNALPELMELNEMVSISKSYLVWLSTGNWTKAYYVSKRYSSYECGWISEVSDNVLTNVTHYCIPEGPDDSNQ